MKILLLGANGQLGWELRRSLSVLGEVVALHRASTPWCGDLTQPDRLAETVAQVAPGVIVNAAAYTAVDRAETEQDAAHAVNVAAPAVLAAAAERLGAWLVHYSTDYVFAGTGEQPWKETDPTAACNAYGRSKLEGEDAIRKACKRHLVLRTSWVFETWGQNFLKSILRAAARQEQLKVVCDQWGAPTRAALLADVTSHMLRQLQPALGGTYHVAAAGHTNWHEYASFAIACAADCGWDLKASPATVQAIPSHEYPQAARRPRNSRLDTGLLRSRFAISLPNWQDGVRAVVAELAARRE